MTEIETYVDHFGRRRVKAVHTDKGRIETDNVVVCGGRYTYTGLLVIQSHHVDSHGSSFNSFFERRRQIS